MTFTQLEYIIALNVYKQFSLAAEKCFVTQPTLSMQIQKLEEELGFKIFDRNKQPIETTKAGKEIVLQAKKIITHRDELLDNALGKNGILSGELHIGIIPTLAPYLLPLFIPKFTKKYKNVKIIINELTTDILLHKLKDGVIDTGILVTPLNDKEIKEDVLFYEELFAYTSKLNNLYEKEYILSSDINPDKLWLLEEGHCFRSQIMNFCELKKKTEFGNQFEYEAGSLETLIRLVDATDGVTFLPELVTLTLSAKQLRQLKEFTGDKPYREVSIITHKDFVKKQLINFLRKEIIDSVPQKLKENKARNILSLT